MATPEPEPTTTTSSSALQLKTSYEPKTTIQPYYSGTPGCVALDREGRILVTGCEDEVVISDFKKGVERARIEGDGEDITTLSLTPDGSYLITCSRSYMMRIYALTIEETVDGEVGVEYNMTRQTKLPAPCLTSAVDSTGTLVATGGTDGLVKVWDIRGGFVTHNIPGHGGVVSALAFYIADGESMASAAEEVEKQNEQRRAGSGSKGGKKEWRGRFVLATGGDDTSIRVFDLETQKAVGPLMGHTSVVRGLSWSSDGKRLVSAGRDGVMCLWETEGWRNVVTPVGEEVEAIGFLNPEMVERADGGAKGRLVWAAGRQDRVRVWDLDGGKELTAEWEGEDEEGKAIIQVIYHANLPYLVSVHADFTIQLHELKISVPAPQTLPVFQHITTNYDEILAIAYIPPANNTLAMATNAPEIRIVDATTFRDLHILRGHTDTVLSLSVDSSGRYLASAGKDNTARLWSLPATTSHPQLLHTLTGHTETIAALALAPSASPTSPPKFLLTGAADRTIKHWDLTRSPPKATYTRRAHEKDINALALSPDCTRFASASQDRTIKIWDTASGETIGVLRGHRRAVWDIAFSPATSTPGLKGSLKNTLLSASTDKTIKLWSLTDYTCIRTFEGHTNTIQRVLFLSPLQALSAGNDGLVKIWNLETAECDVTLDNHSHRIWALDRTPDSASIVSADAAGIVTVWDDTTEEVVRRREEAETKLVEQQQHLENFIALGDYRSAVVLALQLNHPGRLLSILTSSLLTPPAVLEGDEKAARAKEAVEEVIGSLEDGQLATLVLRIRDWNAVARTSSVAQKVLNVVLRSYNRERLAGLKGCQGVWDILEAYTGRHLRRVEEMEEEGWVSRWIMGEMEVVLGREEELEEPKMLKEKAEEEGMQWEAEKKRTEKVVRVPVVRAA